MRKRLIPVILAISLLLTFLGSGVPVQAAAYEVGDVDVDGIVTLRDCAIIARHINGWEGYSLADGSITYPGAIVGSSSCYAGFGQADITPGLSVPMAGFGYTYRRLSEGVLDPLFATAVAVSDGTETALFISIDNIGLNIPLSDPIRLAVANRYGVNENAIFLTCTHTHAGPDANATENRVAADVNRYISTSLLPGILNAAGAAISDLAPAAVEKSTSYTEGINFVRRYDVIYSDDTAGWVGPNGGRTDVKTYVSHETEVDEEVQIICFERNERDDILLYNWQCHPCIMGSDNLKFSSDFVYASRLKLETELSGVRSVFYQGAAGNVAHSDRTGVYSTASTYAYSQTVGRGLADAVIEAYANRTPVEGDTAIRFNKVVYQALENWNETEILAVIEWNKTHNRNTTLTEEEALSLLYVHACAVHDAYAAAFSKTSAVYKQAVQDCVNETGLYLERFHASGITGRVSRTCKRSGNTITSINKNVTVDFPIYTVSIGRSFGFVGVPVEMFDNTATGIKHGVSLDEYENPITVEQSPFDMTFVCGYTNGRLGYMPARYAYPHGCYEDSITRFAPGVAEGVAHEAVASLNLLYQQD